MTLSKNGLALATLLVAVFKLLDVEVDINTMTEVVGAILTIASFVMMAFNQIHRADSKWFLFKKD